MSFSITDILRVRNEGVPASEVLNTLLCPCDICLCRASKEYVEFPGGCIKPTVKSKKNLIHCSTLDKN